MNKLTKKIVSVLGAGALFFSFSANVFAADFADMPDDWTTQALLNAVENGLLYGEESADGTQMFIKPDDNITRAQMAAIIVRAFGASKTADITKYTDVDPEAWYYAEFSKAVFMNAFRGDGDFLNPQNNITFQECFTVISQLLRLDVYQKSTECLDIFSDKEEIAEWAVPYAANVVGNGFWNGIDGKILPTEYITRAEFAALMDNVVKTYIDEPGEYSEFRDGNVMVRVDGVTIKDANIKGDVIVGDGVLDGVIFDNTKIENMLYIRGGNGQGVKLTNNTFAEKLSMITSYLNVSIDATSGTVSGGFRGDDGTNHLHLGNVKFELVEETTETEETTENAEAEEATEEDVLIEESKEEQNQQTEE